jgi:hypothetical protein
MECWRANRAGAALFGSDPHRGMQLHSLRCSVTRSAPDCLAVGVPSMVRLVVCYRRLPVHGRCARRQRRNAMDTGHVPRASFSTGRIEKEEGEVAATPFPRFAQCRSGREVTFDCRCARQRLIDRRDRQCRFTVLHQFNKRHADEQRPDDCAGDERSRISPAARRISRPNPIPAVRDDAGAHATQARRPRMVALLHLG